MNILFVCTHNRCRSILAEAVINHVCADNIKAYSAGSQPEGIVHPMSLKRLSARGINIALLHSKSWDEFSDSEIDLVITVCDSAANESCPLWIGSTPKVHWGLPDPSKLTGSEQEIVDHFDRLIDLLERRAKHLSTLVGQKLSASELVHGVNNISQMEPV